MKNYLFLLIIPWALYAPNPKRPRTPEQILFLVFKAIEREHSQHPERWSEINLYSDDEQELQKQSRPKKVFKRWWHLRSK
ncbi:MAG: hypothetical protein ACJAZS_000465 [Alteromonas naphthalenivorans]|jgi:hypothetical protein